MKTQASHRSSKSAWIAVTPAADLATPTSSTHPSSPPIWELGGEFHWVPTEPCGAGRDILPPDAVLFGNGRQALYAVLTEGRRRFGWRVCHLPSYICQSVAQAVRAADMQCQYYGAFPAARESPHWPPFERREEVLFSVNLLGLQRPDLLPPPDWPNENRIEDHTHDPWSRLAKESSAGYCLVSLRKTLPLPDGGAVWSPLGLPCPTPGAVIPRHATAGQQKLAAMLLKRQYLSGMEVTKEDFRAWQIQSESAMSVRPVSRPLPVTASMLPHLPWRRWRAEKARNAAHLTRRLRQVLPAATIEPNSRDILPRPAEADFPRQCPFAVIVLCANRAERDRLRETLIEHRIYPPILWPLPREAARRCPEAANFAARMLALPCDFRYTPEDMEEAAQVVHEFFRIRNVRNE
ncbi:MAG: hypothetical protein ACUVQK_05395 [Thermogutta sp.]